ncbi:MAG: cytochrome d ubiquinol oxidase subunit II, partial [Flavobacteriales bacterium]|nr:cytochrome d ubiquinol oxidase subunit II [Flavobacteriales bacterium]
IALMMMLVFIQQFPLLLPSTNPDVAGLDIYNSASSTKTLKILLTIAAIGVPLIAFYFGFVYKTFKGKVEMDETSY